MIVKLIGYNTIQSKKGDIFYKLFFTSEIKDKGRGERAFDELTNDMFLNYPNLNLPCQCDLQYDKSFDGRARLSSLSLVE